MCEKCECKKEYQWIARDGWSKEYVSPEDEILTDINASNVSGRWRWGERKFLTEAAAKAAVEKHYNTPEGPDVLQQIVAVHENGHQFYDDAERDYTVRQLLRQHKLLPE